MSTEVPLLNVQVDGVWMQFPKGTKLIDACNKAGKFIPHYCYHPKLSIPGNCRMCLIEMGMPKMGPDRKPVMGPDGHAEIAWIPRAQISCAQDIVEGMGVRTDSPMVQECRKGVMEFLLINHPLDCPICDQAGECRLQEFSVEHGNAQSRFLERKVKKPKNVEIGPRVTLDAERCVLCSRCIRFMKEVAKDDVLGFVDRGGFSTIACHPDKTLESNYSLNTVDICPVGALTSTDFRFKMRVWFLKETKTIDVSDGLGCNILIGSRENKIFRITPRENDDVNQCWMPDSHRLAYKAIHSEDRLLQPTVDGKFVEWSEAIAVALSSLDPTNFSAADGVRSGEIGGILCLGEDLSECGFSNEDLSRLKILVATAMHPSATTKAAHVVLPGAAWAEKRGSMINIHGRLQRLNKAIEPAGQVRDDWEILAGLLQGAQSALALHSIEDVFRCLAQDVSAFSGLNLGKIGDLGIQLLAKDEALLPVPTV
ncbi:MAG: NADH-quinone oxidoreductase subunit L [Verrucomicrobia bacterium]|nr:NADH-quinone oxidoreductase subunit L [Verrucomicrobiota bacterium]